MSADRNLARQLPRPAATVILLRDGEAGPEVFMLKRSPSAAFVANAYVFPGGGLDAADTTARARVAGITDEVASSHLGVEAGGLDYWIAAVRECFEEAGILLAVDESGHELPAERVAALAAHRDAVNDGSLPFGTLLERERLLIPGDRITYYAHWITAPGRPRRFTARFFVALAPAGQHGSHDDAETVESRWVRPREALEACARDEIELVHPTRISLEELSAYSCAAEAFEFARNRTDIEANHSAWANGRDGRKLFRTGQAPFAEIQWSDPDERGDTGYELIPGVAKRLDRHVTRLIAPNPGFMTGPGTNTYLVGERDLAVIDPGPLIDAHVDAILEAGAGRIRWVLCTHTHLDHSPAAVRIKAATGATVLGRPAPRGGNQDQAFAPDRIMEHGERLDIGGVVLRAIHTPGHASNHLCFLLESTRMLFTGDHVMQGSTVVINPPDGDMRAYLASLELLLDEDLAILAPGHGYLIGAPHKEARRLISHRLAREAKVVEAMHRLGPATPEALVAAVYDDVPPKLHPVAMRSLSAHLDKLVIERRAALEAGCWRYVAHPA
ncbi:MAG: MBL fold metallo-hydrolase [Betaproteobacteria bacterium]|nr:MBL fold metallo-hydrolase [Betaproteobacteria bacterium]